MGTVTGIAVGTWANVAGWQAGGVAVRHLMEVMAGQWAKAESPMLCTEWSISTLVSPVQRQKAFAPTAVVVGGSCTVVKEEQP